MVRIVVVEDDPDIRELVEFKLVRAGYDVRTAADGKAGLDAVLEEQPDLVVLDVMLPGMTGLDVCRAIRGTEQVARTPIMIFTARVQENDIQAGFAAGADDYVTKPFSAKELLSRAQALLSRAG